MKVPSFYSDKAKLSFKGKLFFISLLLVITGLCPPEARAQAEKQYYAVFMQGRKIGHAVHSRQLKDNKVITSEQINLTIKRAGIPVTMNIAQQTVETRDAEPVSFEVIQDMSLMTMKVNGTVEKDGTLSIVTESMGQRQKTELDWPESAIMAEGLRQLIQTHGLEKGTEYTARVFDPSVLQALNVKVEIGAKQKINLLGREKKLTKVTNTYTLPGAGEITSTEYLNEQFDPEKVILPLLGGIKVELIACPKEFAFSANNAPELFDDLFIESPEPIRNMDSIISITYYLKPTTQGQNLKIPSNNNQKVLSTSEEGIILTVRPQEAPEGTSFPYRGNNKKLLEATKPTAYLQSDNDKIQELANIAVGDTQDAAEAVKRIESFVAKYVNRKSLSVGYASAAEVADSKKGDCSEFAVLTAALCRAVGIPSQVVVGIVYVEEFREFSGFGPHAWVQANLAGKWIGLDAAFKSAGLGGYGPGHIALDTGNGEPAGFFNMMTTLGKFSIEKIDIKRYK